MKIKSILSIFAAGASAWAITLTYAGHEPPAEPGDGPHILIMASAGTVGSSTYTYSERLGGLAATLRELGYQVTVSDQWTGLSSFTEQQRAELESYDLLWFPRRTSTGDWPRESWQYLNVPILASSPFVTHNSAWDWAFTRTGATEGRTTWMDVMQPHSILDGVAIDMDYPAEITNTAGDAFYPPHVSEFGRIDYRTDTITAYSMAGSYINGRGTGVLRHGMTAHRIGEGEEPDGGDANPAAVSSTIWNLYVWEPGQFRGNERRRVYFNINFEELLSSAPTDSHNDVMDNLTDNGKELIRSVVEWVIADVPVSEHMIENFDRYADGQSVINPPLFDTGRVRDDGNNYQWELLGFDTWSAYAVAEGGAMNVRNDGFTPTTLARRLVAGPAVGGAHPYVMFDFSVRLEDMSALSGTKEAKIVLGSTGGTELTETNIGQNHAVGLKLEEGQISHLTTTGDTVAVANLGVAEWVQVSFLLNLDDQTYDLTINRLGEEVYAAQDQPFLSSVTSLDFVAGLAQMNQAFDVTIEDLTVTSSATLPVVGGYAAWVTAEFTPTEADDLAISGTESDPDGDGIANLLEYMLGLKPKLADRSGLPQTSVQAIEVEGTTADYLTLTITRAGNIADFTISVDTSADLSSWNEGFGILVSSSANGDGTETDVFRSPQPISASAGSFLRASVKAAE